MKPLYGWSWLKYMALFALGYVILMLVVWLTWRVLGYAGGQ